jgi:hypothetical protein
MTDLVHIRNAVLQCIWCSSCVTDSIARFLLPAICQREGALTDSGLFATPTKSLTGEQV